MSSASAKAWKLYVWHVRIGWVTLFIAYMHHPISYDIIQGLQALYVACPNRLWLSCIDQCQTISSKTCLHQTLCVRINLGTVVMAREHWPKVDNIVHSLHALDVACVCISKRCLPMSVNISQCMHASSVVCAHMLGNISHGLHVSDKTYAHMANDIY